MSIVSLKRKATVVCPVCLEEFETDIYRVVNEGEFPDFDPAKLNIVKCPGCGNEFRVGERIVLYRPEDDIVIIVYPDDDEDERFVRTVLREVKILLRDLRIELPEIVTVVGWARFIFMWEIMARKDLVDQFLKDYKDSGKVLFYRKLEQLAQIYLEFTDSSQELDDPRIREMVRKRFDNIVDI